MNLFWKKLMGGITPTAKLEKYEVDLLEAMQRYAKVEKSVELAEYKSLFHVVKSPEFQDAKKILQNRKFKDTEEYRVYKKYEKLSNSRDIQLYYEVLKSEELNRFLEFKKTPEFELLGDVKKTKASESLTHFKQFKDSKSYKIYTRFHESFIIKEFAELKVKVADPEFIKKKEFWANAKRWQTTPEFVQQERYYELAKNPDIVFFENENPERFKKFMSLKLSYSDEFTWNTLTKSDWNFGFHYKNPSMITNHSFNNEKQANNGGKNIAVENGILQITTKLEKTTAKTWHPTKGFIEKEFEFTSDVLQCADNFTQKYGVFKAKLRCTGHIHHAFWLGSDNKLPHVNIFHFDGKKITIGNSNENVVDGINITGLNPSEYYIYTLVWTEKELAWFINDYEVYRTASNIPKTAMYMGFNSFISKKQHDTGMLEVDWVRVYQN